MLSADQILAVVWRRKTTAALVALCVFIAAAVVTYALPKTYSTSAYLVVNTIKPTTSDFEAQQVSQVDTQTAAQLLQTRNTADAVARHLPFRLSPTGVQQRVSISAIAQTQLVLVTATGPTPLAAQQLANAYADVFTQQTAPTIGFARIAVTEPAPLVTAPSAPSKKLYLLVALVLSVAAAVAAAAIRDRLDAGLHIEPTATEVAGLPILARVPDVSAAGGLRRQRAFESDDLRFVEGIRWVLANLAFLNGGTYPAGVAVLSASQGEGKSTVSLALARAAEETLDGDVVLVDGDLRRPSLSRLAPNPDGAGLSEYLVSPHRDDDDRAYVQTLPGSELALVTAGRQRDAAARLLAQRALHEFMAETRELYEMVVFDTPPMRAGADAALIAVEVGAAIVVLDAITSSRSAVTWSLEQLKRAGVNVLGVIVNRSPEDAGIEYYADGPAGARGAAAKARKQPQ